MDSDSSMDKPANAHLDDLLVGHRICWGVRILESWERKKGRDGRYRRLGPKERTRENIDKLLGEWVRRYERLLFFVLMTPAALLGLMTAMIPWSGAGVWVVGGAAILAAATVRMARGPLGLARLNKKPVLDEYLDPAMQDFCDRYYIGENSDRPLYTVDIVLAFFSAQVSSASVADQLAGVAARAVCPRARAVGEEHRKM